MIDSPEHFLFRQEHIPPRRVGVVLSQLETIFSAQGVPADISIPEISEINRHALQGTSEEELVASLSEWVKKLKIAVDEGGAHSFFEQNPMFLHVYKMAKEVESRKVDNQQ